MSKFPVQKIIERKSIQLLRNALDISYFELQDFGSNDSTPDIDGQLRLMDGIDSYLNLYLHYQAKGTDSMEGESYYCSWDILNYLSTTNIPTVLFIADTKSKRLYWYFLKEAEKQKVIRDSDKKGRRLNLKGKEVPSEPSVLLEVFKKIALPEDYEAKKAELGNIVDDYHLYITNCIGLVFLLQRVKKDEAGELFASVLNVGAGVAEDIVGRLASKGVITATRNYYVVDSDELGRECLTDLIEKLGGEGLSQLFERKEDQKGLLTRLADTDTPSAEAFLKQMAGEFVQYSQNSTDNDVMGTMLEYLSIISRRVPDDTITVCRNILFSKKPLPHKSYEVFGLGTTSGKDHPSLMVDCLELLNTVRYHEVRKVVRLAISFAANRLSKGIENPLRTLVAVAQYNIHVLQQVGYAPQLILIDELEKISATRRRKLAKPIVEVLEELLAPDYETSYMSSYNTVTISRGGLVVTDAYRKVRARAISLLKSIFVEVDSREMRLAIMKAFRTGASPSRRGGAGKKELELYRRDTKNIAEFLFSVWSNVDLGVCLSVEEWCVYQSQNYPRVRVLQQLDKKILGDKDFSFCKLFLGDDVRGIWRDSGIQEHESRVLGEHKKILGRLGASTYPSWSKKFRTLLEEISIGQLGREYYLMRFCQVLGLEKPQIALRFIAENEKQSVEILSDLLTGLIRGGHFGLIRNRVRGWVTRGKYLSELSYGVRNGALLDKDITALFVDAACRSRNVIALGNLADMLIENFQEFESGWAKVQTLKCINILVKSSDPSPRRWVPYRSDELLSSLTGSQLKRLLSMLAWLPNVGYEAEELLCKVGKQNPELVIDYFQKRSTLRHKCVGKKDDRIWKARESIPYRLGPKLVSELQQHSELVVPLILDWFKVKDLRWDAARLFTLLFPKLNGICLERLTVLVKQRGVWGRKVVELILSSYVGGRHLVPLVSELMRKYGTTKDVRKQYFSALARTGVVSGEHGFSEAHKAKVEEIPDLEAEKSKRVIAFWKEYKEYLESNAEFFKETEDEEILLRKKGVYNH